LFELDGGEVSAEGGLMLELQHGAQAELKGGQVFEGHVTLKALDYDEELQHSEGVSAEAPHQQKMRSELKPLELP
jgi:hypothetical protein